MTMPQTPSVNGPMLYVRYKGHNWSFPPARTVEVGRGALADVRLDDERVSHRQVRIWHSAGAWWVADQSSRNGTWVVGAEQALDRPMSLPSEGLVLRLGSLDGPELLLSSESPRKQRGQRVLSVGRSRSSDIVVNDPLVSRRHATIAMGEQIVLRDEGSFNGTFVNGDRVHGEATLHVGDQIGLGSSSLAWNGVDIAQPPPQRPVFSARHLEVTTRAGNLLLDDVSMSAPAGTLMAIIGPVGGAKSALLAALTGLQHASRGHVMWNGRDFYAEYERMRFLVGLVPQVDILHSQLTVRRALHYAARLRLPPDTSEKELEARVDQVLAEMDLTKQKNQRIDRLSGSQRKGASIALELLTAPQLLFLDEPTSGLDPVNDKQVMGSLRSLADAGRVVLVATHSVPALDVCDRVLVLTQEGRVAFFGPPGEMLRFFAVDNYAEAFAALKHKTWASLYARSPARSAYLGRTTHGSVSLPAGDSPPPPRAAPLRQLWTLVRRNAWAVAADRLFVILLTGMPLLLALVAHAFPGRAGLSIQEASGNPYQIQQRLIVLVVGATLMGTTLAARDFVAERPIYRRERAAGLSPGAYLLSKVVVLGLLVACQCAAFVMVALLGLPGPDDALVLGNGHIEVAAAVAAVGITTTIAALVVSAATTSTKQTLPFLVALAVGQLLLCGGLFAIAGRVGLEQVSWLMPARFGYAATAATVGLQKPTAPLLDPLFEPTAVQWLTDISFLGLQALVFLTVAAWALHRPVSGNSWK